MQTVVKALFKLAMVGTIISLFIPGDYAKKCGMMAIVWFVMTVLTWTCL